MAKVVSEEILDGYLCRVEKSQKIAYKKKWYEFWKKDSYYLCIKVVPIRPVSTRLKILLEC